MVPRALSDEIAGDKIAAADIPTEPHQNDGGAA